MIRAIKILIVILVTVSGITHSYAQHSYSNTAKLVVYQDSLIKLSDETFSAKHDEVRLENNALFIKKLVSALQINGSFGYGFDSLRRITVLKSPDNNFRIITWFIPMNDGGFRYYGTIQMATSNGALKLFPLTDGTATLANTNELTSNRNWYGARYYEMIPVIVNGKQPYWIFLGWKGNTEKTTKKVIDVLSFDKGEPVFGKAIFPSPKDKAIKNRVIFEYSKQNAMTLTVDHRMNMIVFDHLAPYDSNMVGNYEYYGSDLSFDAYKLQWGKLNLLENVELKNEPSPNDEFYGRPVKASMVIIKAAN